MRLDRFLVKLGTSVALLLVIASAPAAAVSVHGASHYGPDPGFLSCEDGTDNCQAFNLTPTVVNFGGNTYDVFQFVTNDGVGDVSVYNVVDLHSLGANATFSLPPTFFTPAQTEILGCGGASDPFDGSTFPTDSSFPALKIPGICTAGSTVPSVTLNADGTFTTGKGFDLADLVLDAPVGTASTPEPGTLFLLGVGLAAVGRRLRRAV
jgi:PEP-CTERM motif-containing protein